MQPGQFLEIDDLCSVEHTEVGGLAKFITQFFECPQRAVSNIAVGKKAAAQFEAGEAETKFAGDGVTFEKALRFERDQHAEGRAGIELDALANLGGAQFGLAREEGVQDIRGAFKCADVIAFASDGLPRRTGCE